MDSNASILLEIIINIAEIGLIYFFLYHIFPVRSNSKMRNYSMVALEFVILCYINYYLSSVSLWGIFFIALSLIMINLIIFKAKWTSIMIIILIWLIMLGVVESLLVFLISQGMGIETFELLDNTVYRFITALFCRLIMYFVAAQMHKSLVVSTGLSKIYVYEIIMILAFNTILMLVLNSFFAGVIHLKVSYGMVLCAVTISSLLIIKIFSIIMDYASKEAEYESQLQYIKSMNDFIQELRAQRHDFNHHLGCISGLLSNDKYNEVSKYVDNIIDRATEMNSLLETNNPYILAILNHKVSIAKQKQIAVSLEIRLSEEVKIDPIDLSIVIGNALDNAMEACEKVENGKYIHIRIYEELQYVIINIKNSHCSSHLVKSLSTTKKDKINHGFGLKNMEYVVKKYKGKMKVSSTKNQFALSILLDN